MFPTIDIRADENIPNWFAIGLIPIDMRIKVKRPPEGLKIAMHTDAVKIKSGILSMNVCSLNSFLNSCNTPAIDLQRCWVSNSLATSQ